MGGLQALHCGDERRSKAELTNLLGAYWSRLTCDDAEVRKAAAAAFVGYELSISKTYIDPAVIEEYMGTPTILIPFAVMEVHYVLNGGFMKRGQLLDNVASMAEYNHKVAICHGRGDYVPAAGDVALSPRRSEKKGCEVELEFVAGQAIAIRSRGWSTRW